MKVRVNSRGVITIPAEIRKKYGFHPGTEVDFILKGDEINMIKRKSPEETAVRNKEASKTPKDKLVKA